MKSELNDLLNLRNALVTEHGNLKAEYDDLVNINRSRTEEDYDRINILRERIEKITTIYNDLSGQLSEINDINEKLKSLNESYNNVTDTTQKEAYLAEMQEINKKLEDKISEVYNNFEKIIGDSDFGLGPIKEPKKKFKLNKKIVMGGITTIALLIAIGTGCYLYSKNNDNKIGDKKNPGDNSGQNSNSNEIKEEKVEIPELENLTSLTKVTNEEEIPAKANELLTCLNAIAPDNNYTLEDVTEYLKQANDIKDVNIDQDTNTNSNTNSNLSTEVNLEFTDIKDEEQVAKRANEIIEDLNKNANGHDYTIEEIENIMKWVNNGVVDDPSQAACLYNELRVENLWNKENQEEVSEAFDTSKLFKDGTQGQKLAKKIYDLRVKLMNAESNEDYKKYAEEFTVLLVNSWVLNGTNNEISVFALETSFSKALLDSYFLNTYALIHEENIVVTVNDNEFNLDDVANEINKAVCPATMQADNGEYVNTLVNKFTSDMIGAEEEATRTKENSYTLTK